MKRVVVLSRAGINTDSGLRTFRGADGLWEDHRVEKGGESKPPQR